MKIREMNLDYNSKPELPQELKDALDEGIRAAEEGRVVDHEEAMRILWDGLKIEKI